MSNNLLCEQLRMVLTRLAAPAAAQVEFLRSINTYPSADELALEFSDLVKPRGRLRSDCSLSEEVLTSIDALDELLLSFSGEGQSAEWDASALASSKNWAEARALAKQILDAI